MGVSLQKHYICSTVTDYLSFFRKQIYEITANKALIDGENK